VFSALIKILTLDCEEASLLLSKSFDERLSRSERIAMRLHFWICTACRRIERQLKYLQRTIQHARKLPSLTFPHNEKLSEEARERIKARMRELMG